MAKFQQTPVDIGSLSYYCYISLLRNSLAPNSLDQYVETGGIISLFPGG